MFIDFRGDRNIENHWLLPTCPLLVTEPATLSPQAKALFH